MSRTAPWFRLAGALSLPLLSGCATIHFDNGDNLTGSHRVSSQWHHAYVNGAFEGSDPVAPAVECGKGEWSSVKTEFTVANYFPAALVYSPFAHPFYVAALRGNMAAAVGVYVMPWVPKTVNVSCWPEGITRPPQERASASPPATERAPNKIASVINSAAHALTPSARSPAYGIAVGVGGVTYKNVDTRMTTGGPHISLKYFYNDWIELEATAYTATGKADGVAPQDAQSAAALKSVSVSGARMDAMAGWHLTSPGFRAYAGAGFYTEKAEIERSDGSTYSDDLSGVAWKVGAGYNWDSLTVDVWGGVRADKPEGFSDSSHTALSVIYRFE